MAKASNNQFPSVLFGEGTTPASPASGTQRIFIDSSDHKLKRVNSSGSVTTIEGGGGGGTSVTSATAAGSGSADLSTTSTSMVDLTGLSATIAAAAGNKLLCTFTGSAYASTGSINTDVGINIGGTVRVQNITKSPNVSIALPISVQILYTVVSGDITGGNVTVKIQWMTSSGTSFMVNSSSRIPQLTVLNLG